MSAVRELIPVAPIAEAVLKSRLTMSQICRELGWTRSDRTTADTTRLKRRLGLASNYSVHRGQVYSGKQEMIGYDLALKIVAAADIDPVDAGL
jgi:hypothetical protein